MTTVLVSGATGTIGRELVGLLAGQGVCVRAMVRRPADADALRAPGVEPVIADLDDPSSLARALDGVDALFLNTPSSAEARDRQIRCADLAVAVGVRRLVLLSQYAARADSPVRFLRWHAEVEDHVGALDLEVTVLRPNLFLQGMLTMAGAVREHGTLGAPIGSARVSMVDTRDIAAVAAVALTQPGHAGAVYTLTGPAAVSHHEVAEAISAATGRDVQFADLPDETFATMLDGVLPAWQRDGLLEDYAHYRRGEAAVVDPAVPTVLGRPARDLAAFARDHAGAFAA
ncbi:SDR family oxidoreductase [Actinomycetospora endophytica]|uniref:SDR family oxidoreductase n=1 Tax=Actinomycetospora endophytica TaxID=2291215 RepID=A0ABS8P3P7_9PSEU|nr:SDR family oxidoreductase [Actinomycetospora endophytica]MCD2192185.1 SDR family oxidoreductase [Actinomycetospora endophytica]